MKSSADMLRLSAEKLRIIIVIFFAVVAQTYTTDANKNYVILGNSALHVGSIWTIWKVELVDSSPTMLVAFILI